MQTPAYDILKKADVYLIWVEQARDLEAARLRIIQLAAQSHMEHVILDQRTRKIVAKAVPRTDGEFTSGARLAGA